MISVTSVPALLGMLYLRLAKPCCPDRSRSDGPSGILARPFRHGHHDLRTAAGRNRVVNHADCSEEQLTNMVSVCDVLRTGMRVLQVAVRSKRCSLRKQSSSPATEPSY